MTSYDNRVHEGPRGNSSLSESLANKLPRLNTEPQKNVTVIQSGQEFRSRLAKHWKPDSTANSCHSCRKAFHLFRRKHHCRFCGEIYCAKCARFRVTWVNSTRHHNRGSDQQSMSQPYSACELCFALFMDSKTTNSDVQISSAPVEIVNKRGRSNTRATLPGHHSIHCNDADHFVHQAGTNVGNVDHLSSSVPIPTTIYCPVCSVKLVSTDGNFEPCEDSDVDRHIDECVKIQSQVGCIGDRYSSFVYSASQEEIECSICYEHFLVGQQIALLNCFCKYHEHCISTWFLKGRGCPFHPKRQSERYLR